MMSEAGREALIFSLAFPKDRSYSSTQVNQQHLSDTSSAINLGSLLLENAALYKIGLLNQS
jgi:hypothetical protein